MCTEPRVAVGGHVPDAGVDVRRAEGRSYIHVKGRRVSVSSGRAGAPCKRKFQLSPWVPCKISHVSEDKKPAEQRTEDTSAKTRSAEPEACLVRSDPTMAASPTPTPRPAPWRLVSPTGVLHYISDMSALRRLAVAAAMSRPCSPSCVLAHLKECSKCCSTYPTALLVPSSLRPALRPLASRSLLLCMPLSLCSSNLCFPLQGVAFQG